MLSVLLKKIYVFIYLREENMHVQAGAGGTEGERKRILSRCPTKHRVLVVGGRGSISGPGNHNLS